MAIICDTDSIQGLNVWAHGSRTDSTTIHQISSYDASLCNSFMSHGEQILRLLCECSVCASIKMRRVVRRQSTHEPSVVLIVL